VAADANVGAELTIVANSDMVSDNGFAMRREESCGRLHMNVGSVLNPGIAHVKHEEATNVITNAFP
jgi:hypothetical protein